MTIGVKSSAAAAETSYLRARSGPGALASHLWPKVTMQYPEEKSSKD
jgi:hypothetical protein